MDKARRFLATSVEKVAWSMQCQQHGRCVAAELPRHRQQLTRLRKRTARGFIEQSHLTAHQAIKAQCAPTWTNHMPASARTARARLSNDSWRLAGLGALTAASAWAADCRPRCSADGPLSDCSWQMPEFGAVHCRPMFDPLTAA
eukprot:365004-Chlamydomonas_euryale.AAC.5